MAPERVALGRAFSFCTLAWLSLAAFAADVRAQESPDIDPTDLRAMSLEELMDLDVTSVSRAPEPYAQAAAAIQVITQQQIRRSGASTIAEALRLATSLHVAQKNAQSWAISARGFNTDLANKLLVLIDGRSVYTPLFSGVFWDRQDYVLEDIDRIEVISGPGGALWGANAVNGVINIITKGARDSEGLYADARVGPRMGAFGAARFGDAPTASFAYRVYGKYFDRDNEVLADGSQATDSWKRTQFGFRSDATSASGDLFTLQGDLYDADLGSPTGGRGDARGYNVLGRWTRTFSASSDLKLQLYWDFTHLMIPTPEQVLNGTPVAPAGTLEDDLDTYDVDFQHRFRLGGRATLVWGLGYRFTSNEIQSAPGLAFEPARLDRNLVHAFLENELSLSPSVTAVIGTKVEHNDYTDFELEPTARLAWSRGPRTVWLAASRAVRMPSRVDRHERLPTPGFAPLVENLLVGNDSFVSETLLALELGYRTRLGANAAAAISTFYNRYDDLRSTSTSPPDPVFQLPFPFYFDNNLEATTYGAELVADVVLREDWSLRGGYTLLHEDVEVKEGQADFNNALNETADPEHQVSLFSSMDLPGGVDLDVGVRWIGSFTYNESGVAAEVPDYWETDARAAWRPTAWAELAIEGQNLLNDQHLEYVISSPNPRQEIRRAIRGRVSIRW
ncbi:MAG: TonB-dependent receptor plug domain-containing protein [Gemmatimonadales bacterium]